MSILLEMLQVARLAPGMLGGAAPLVAQFLRTEQNEDGGFRDREGRSDLYYTVFGISGVRALETVPGLGSWEAILASGRDYAGRFGDGESLDFVHLCCLARCLSGGSAGTAPPGLNSRVLARIETHRTMDGGYHTSPQSEAGSAYANFLALGAYQDLGLEPPHPLRLVQSFKLLETPDGAWRNDRLGTAGSTNATAAAITALRQLGMPINLEVGEWLLQRAHPRGGFLATPNAPIPDLLSTATALHALSGLQVAFDHLREPCLDFLDTLWTNGGAFHGNWTDDHVDCEYTFYGLLALGHLSL